MWRQSPIAPKILLLFVVCFFLTGIRGYAENNPIKIGFVGDFSDVTKEYCTNAYNAALIAVDDFNLAGGLWVGP